MTVLALKQRLSFTLLLLGLGLSPSSLTPICQTPHPVVFVSLPLVSLSLARAGKILSPPGGLGPLDIVAELAALDGLKDHTKSVRALEQVKTLHKDGWKRRKRRKGHWQA